jgi:dihydroflavonol-4-reductase
VPYLVALAAAYASELIADVFTHQRPAATITGVRLAARWMHFDASRSLADLDLTPRPVHESLRDAVAWYRRIGWLS